MPPAAALIHKGTPQLTAGPAWRWIVASSSSYRRRRQIPAAYQADKWLMRLIHVVALLRQASSYRAVRKLQRNDRDIVGALRLWESRSEQRRLVEALVLADAPVREIAAAAGLPLRTIKAFEAGFFDVRKLLQFPAYVQVNLIVPAVSRDRLDLSDGLWKVVAAAGGASALLAFRDRRQLLSAEHARLFARLARHYVGEIAWRCTITALPKPPKRRGLPQPTRLLREGAAHPATSAVPRERTQDAMRTRQTA